ncbi:uncharacterized protein KNAG_0D05330 [Huiozyma naganishii CBS 8797]|uniref:Pyridoxamine 5'-phosphate oxidase N-terminal domain-containing protein n=1 Tax=Huiozyma naganishii (strain ATCC MYA-139 / BCRC 22969 / CBS 8797 / KCTC 17520 / NBRC 10181 / NCYC 3082 / Yp74L-3) TaxID=1071383 RepID=J7S7D9_HUIN7|nr:hypothetical protein KNAG_0D05330 [Kazachstania naganishii CBS 8797]CCK70271.1 hypothetical protein KNAG_0D05330 [Kazachstania naganishii CBS 8797]
MFPPKLLELVRESKFVHLGTCSLEAVPSVALMNYLYVDREDSYLQECGVIIMAGATQSDKCRNILYNDHVSLLLHDWIAAENMAMAKQPVPWGAILQRTDAARDEDHMQWSATIRGEAQVLQSSSGECQYYKQLLLRANPDAEVYILGGEEDVSIIKVKMTVAKVTDKQNNTYEFINAD